LRQHAVRFEKSNFFTQKRIPIKIPIKNDVLRGLKPAVSLARMVLITRDINESFLQ